MLYSGISLIRLPSLQLKYERDINVAVNFTGTEPIILHFGPLLQKIDDREFFEFCRLNPELRIECSSDGDLIITPPTGGKTGGRNFFLTGEFFQWAKADGTGKGFDSSTGFTLPNGAKRSPDLAWITLGRWNALSEEEQERFPPLCPDFVVELLSRFDALAYLRRKMEEYIANGAQLGWLIDPVERRVYIYRPQIAVECLDHPLGVSGEPLLPGFTLDLEPLW